MFIITDGKCIKYDKSTNQSPVRHFDTSSCALNYLYLPYQTFIIRDGKCSKCILSYLFTDTVSLQLSTCCISVNPFPRIPVNTHFERPNHVSRSHLHNSRTIFHEHPCRNVVVWYEEYGDQRLSPVIRLPSIWYWSMIVWSSLITTHTHLHIAIHPQKTKRCLYCLDARWMFNHSGVSQCFGVWRPQS